MPKSRKATTLHELLLNKLQVLYDVEQQILKALPKMVKKVANEDLKQGFAEHLEQTENHVNRLEQCFKLLGAKPKKLSSDAIRGLVSDAAWVMEHVAAGPALDANLIAAAQYVEHYEIAGYGTAVEWAKLMNHNEVAQLLDETFKEEILTDEKLSDLAETQVNSQVPQSA